MKRYKIYCNEGLKVTRIVMMIFTFKFILMSQINQYCLGIKTTGKPNNFYNSTIEVINNKNVSLINDDICINRKGEYNGQEHYNIAKSIFNFTNLLYETLSSPLPNDINVSESKNMIFSPYSIHSAMGILLLGCKNTTAKEILDNAFPDTGKKVHQRLNSMLNRFTVGNRYFNLQHVTLTQANRLYVMKEYNLIQKFINKLKECYLASSTKIDFGNEEAARNEINQWVENVTKDKIKQLIAPGILSNDTHLVLVNAIYFHGMWEHPFNKNNITPEEFTTYKASNQILGGNVTGNCSGEDCAASQPVIPLVLVNMMHQTEYFEICNLKNMQMDARALQMEYIGGKLSMVIILPNKKNGLDEVQANFKHFNFLNCFTSYGARKNKREVILSIPKFIIENEYELKEPLQQMGIKDVFDRNKADLSGIGGKRRLFVSFHIKCFGTVIQWLYVFINASGSIFDLIKGFWCL